MKRFIDLRYRGTGARFAWWDTSVDKFDSYRDEYAWTDWKDLESAVVDDAKERGIDAGYLKHLLDRLRGLCPLWVFEAPSDEELLFLESWRDPSDEVQELRSKIAALEGGGLAGERRA